MIAEGYEEFKTKILALTKIDLNAYKERQMKRRIDSLIEKNGLSQYNDYVKLLNENHSAYEEFVNYITINVSEFYRNPEQWVLLEKEILPLLLSSNSTIKIWSAACSTGDEPYSLVMLLSKFMPLNRIKIFATDIDQQILDKAKAGVYNIKSLKGLPAEFLTKYFTQISDNSYKISQDIINCVEFKKHNLLKDSYPTQFDLIVCRNVVIYFTEEAKESVYRKFHSSLKENGILFVGSTEQIIQPSALGFQSFKSFYYKKIPLK